MQWFKSRNQWVDNDIQPTPGMIAFFDWNDSNGQDGAPDHVGIVQKIKNGKVFIIEGNSSDSCKVNQYTIGNYQILGYGIPAY